MGVEIAYIFPQLGEMTSEIASHYGCVLSESTATTAENILLLIVLNLF